MGRRGNGEAPARVSHAWALYNPPMSVRRRARVTVCLIVATVGVLSPAARPLLAWGAVGHRVVARLAWELMTPEARSQAMALLEAARDPSSTITGPDAFVAAATWADEVRPSRPETYNWHFVDIPVTAPGYDAARDCPPTGKGDCAIAEIARARAELGNTARPAALKGESLKFLIHIVGDLHQPLHATDHHDRGGNDVKVAALQGEGGRATNLHAVWDTGLINLSTETEMARAARLLAALRATPLDVSLNALAWAEESHDIGVRLVYRYPSFAVEGPGPDPITLDEAYRIAAIAEIDRRHQQAGMRLAALLNSILK